MSIGPLYKKIGTASAEYHGTYGQRPEAVLLNPDDWAAIKEFFDPTNQIAYPDICGLAATTDSALAPGTFTLVGYQYSAVDIRTTLTREVLTMPVTV